MITWSDAHRRAAVLAAQFHADLDIELRRPVDVFAAVQRLGLVLAFVPLGKVSGLYLPGGGASGVLIHAGHPRTKQRYTAGHELGHHAFGHTAEVDGDLELGLRRDANRWPDHEKEAEAFGAWFLMPRRLLREGLRQLQIDTPTSPGDVYSLALWLGTSYTATARQLGATRIVEASQAEQWARIEPRTIKLALAAGYAPDDLQNDVRWLDHASNRHPVDVRPGDRLVLTLDEIPSSGHSWRFSELPEGFVVLADSYDDHWEPRLPHESPTDQDSSRDEIAGDSSPRSFAIDITPAVLGGIYPLMLVKDRPWTSDDPINEFEVLVSVHPRLHGVQLTEAELLTTA
ncbi:MAG: ImmA/IrrE family metallo-endopeptidase [Pseudonocardiaceae bacterium]|nr:ImmA/IrrE family metallo-endopeptidase [Pseudonocardiaceae bacterium]